MQATTNVFTLFVIAALALLLSACAAPAAPAVPTAIANAPDTDTEIIRADILSGDAISSDITVLGVRLGMTESQVLALLGPADLAQEYDFGAIQNWEYGRSIGLPENGLTIHLRNGIVTRIALYPEMNDLLIGETKVQGNRENVYAVLGLPDRQYDIRGGRFFVYNERGLEVYFDNKGVSALGIVFANRKLPTTATTGILNGTRPTVPTLILDTTTLCNQGATFAYNIGTDECRAYTNACVIPANEVEVRGCSPEFTTDEAISRILETVW